MKVLTWNVNCFTANRVAQKLRLLELTEWDVALLQEVGETTFATLTDCTGFEGVHALALTGGAHSHRDHGAAILVRDGHIADPELFDLHDGLGYDEVGSPSARAVRATASIQGIDVRIASLHAYDAAGQDPEHRDRKRARKQRFYGTVNAWCCAQSGPTVLGGDFNTWWDPAESVPVDPNDPFAEEQRFVVPGAAHGLVDVQLAHFRSNDPAALERRRQLGAVGLDGALAVTYQRSSRQHPKVNRMDRIFASHEFAVRSVDTNYGDALTVGSDHALVTAELDFHPTT